MGRKARAKREPTIQAPDTRYLSRRGPNWALFALSAVGVLLTVYLTWTWWRGSALKGCALGSRCDVVLSSPWATLFGLPTSFWGLLAYLTLAGTAFIRRAERHWLAAWSVAFFGVCYSTYLTVVSLIRLGGMCPYCLASLGLMTAIVALVSWERPASREVFSWPRWLARAAPAAAAVIVALHLHYIGVIGAPPEIEDPTTRALAIHLSNTGAKMYGASWCPHCQQQKALFGKAARRLPYVECSTGGQGSPLTDVCREANIRIYPTWVIRGVRTEEVMSLQQLAEASGVLLTSP